MDENLYDEFGNYIGPEIDDDDSADEMDAMEQDTVMGDAQPASPGPESYAIAHRPDSIFPDAETVYPGAETLVQEEDTQPLTQPIIAPVKKVKFEVIEKSVPKTSFTIEFLTGLLDKPDLIRNVAVVGSFSHGKTAFMDMLINHTHQVTWDLGSQVRYTDTRIDEQERGISIKSTPMTLALQTSKGKSYAFNLIDTPGHVNFSDEVTAAIRLTDGVIVIVDVVEGVMAGTARLIKHAIQEQQSIVIVINKLDRLILELKLPPTDAYFKIRSVLDEINDVFASVALGTAPQRFSPDEGNIVFMSSLIGFSFTLQSFAQMYADYYGAGPSFAVDFAKKLWGDWYMQENRKFSKKPSADVPDQPRAFVQFILEPLYKLFSQAVGEDPKDLEATAQQLGIKLRKSELALDSAPLLRLVLQQFFGAPTPLIDTCVRLLPSPAAAAERKIQHIYTGPLDMPIAQSLKECNSKGSLMMNVTKLYTKGDATAFDSFGRVFSGTLKKGTVSVLSEAFSESDIEEKKAAVVEHIYICNARYRFEVNQAPAGALVLVEGIDQAIIKTATVVDAKLRDEDLYIFRPLVFNTIAVCKIAVEPLIPAELPKMKDGLRKIVKSYPLLSIKVEESGEHVIMGTGELYLDCALRDLRELYAEIEIKVSDPVVTFRETVVETSSLKCFCDTPNKKNRITMIAEPMDKDLAEDIDSGEIAMTWERKRMQDFFKQKFKWDALAARSIWAFGGAAGPNILINDSLPTETDKQKLESIKDSIVQGFEWGSREGPLCDEPIRNVKFKLLSAQIADEPVFRNSGQIIPTSRRVTYSAFLMATPRLMEPIFYAEIQCPGDCVAAVYTVLARRRGHILQDTPKPGTTLYTVRANLPVIDSIGFETDVRAATQGQAYVQTMFERWAVVPGDPLDKEIQLRPLEPAPAMALAREFMVKTRRRKGLSDDVSINKFFDDPMLLNMAQQAADAFM
eukprot:TRINITY_DN2667_c0_g1_i1.p1 TRINITY_DN2667_c0_g1~~TRINITY_DN2667_c0_g1_i1.p1  ORF type:complete len:964 (-),score=265.86 TRINITY_DN2667_c0_g1_i1:22-2913(-)